MGKPRRYQGEWSPREVPWVLNVLPRKNIEDPLLNFQNASPWPQPWPDQRPKTLGACSPSGFWPLVWLWMWPRVRLWGPSIFSLGSTLITLGKLHRGSIHHATSLAFTQIVPFFLPNALEDWIYHCQCLQWLLLTFTTLLPRVPLENCLFVCFSRFT